MKAILKKFLSVTLVVVLTLAAAPLGGFAGLDLSGIFVLKAEAATYSGSCGTNLKWSLNTSTGVLSITGTGAMDDYAYPNYPTWYTKRSNIKKAVIGDGVTTIGNSAFFYCTELTSVTIPDTVVSLGNSAFRACHNLVGVTIPEQVRTIGEGAFAACFSLSHITVDEDNNYYSSDIYGVLFNKSKTKLVLYPIGNIITSYNIPDSVKTLGDSAFTGSENLVNITISENVTTIEENAFGACSKLKEIKIPDSVTSIGELAFAGCSSIKEIVIPDSVINVGRDAFGSCEKLTSAIIGDGIELISDFMFNRCPQLKNIKFGKNVKFIGDNAFELCTSLEKVLIPDGVTSIGYEAFSLCSALEYVHIPPSVTNIEKNIVYNTTICSTTENSYAKTYADANGIEFKVCDGHSFAIFSTNKSFTVKTGESMSLAFGSLINGELDGEWEKMAITVSDPTIVSLSDYKKTEYGYSLDVIGKKEGVTNLTITDAETGENVVLAVTVDDSYNKTYSYAIDNIATFYPNNKWENNIATNIYNLNGIYINNYNCIKSGNNHKVSFNAYNEMYHNGSVDIYDADGNWLGAEKIEKYSDMTSIFETGEQIFYMFADWEWLSYTHNMHTKETAVSFEVPDGGYFTISNNFAESPGCFLYNTADIFFEGVSAAIDVITDNVETPFADLLMDKIKDNKATRELFIEIFINAADKEIRQYSKNITNGIISNSYSGLCGLFENMLDSLDIEWKHLLSSATGIGESVFKKLSGPAGLALDGCFAISESTNKFLQAMNIGWSVDEPYVCVYSDIEEGYINPHGVIVNTNGNTDTETVLQVFRISNDDSVKVVLNSNNPLEMHELYNISFVKNDKNVQPNGEVKVYVPIPEGMDSSTSKIYRQEANGSWTVLNAKVEGNYLVFETDHFSLYAIVGNKAGMKISSLPDKLTYTLGDTLDSTGLSLEINGTLITSGFYCDSTVIYKPGTQKITVHYSGLTAEFDISVNWETPVIASPSTSSINYGDTLVLQHSEIELPKGYSVEWAVEGSGVTIQSGEDGAQCRITSISSGTATVTAKIVDENGKPVLDSDGNEIFDEITLKSNAGFFQKLISFFKNLFGINRIIF